MIRGRDARRPALSGRDDPPPVPPGVDPEVPSPARLYDCYLGGTTNYPADQQAAERIRRDLPEISDVAWANRGFHQRAAKWLARDRGISQFLDLGSGLPTQGNTHQVIREVTADARVVYVDHDPMVRAYAGELLTDSRLTTFVFADLRDPGRVLGNRQLRDLIDFTEPVGLLMTAVLPFVADSADPWGLVARYTQALAPGSYLALSHVTADNVPERGVATVLSVYERATESIHPRPKAEVERFFAGLELVAPWPGETPRLVYLGEWGAEDPQLADSDGSRWGYAGLGRRP
jgi:S-adenosyl methyltransferase